MRILRWRRIGVSGNQHKLRPLSDGRSEVPFTGPSLKVVFSDSCLDTKMPRSISDSIKRDRLRFGLRFEGLDLFRVALSSNLNLVPVLSGFSFVDRRHNFLRIKQVRTYFTRRKCRGNSMGFGAEGGTRTRTTLRSLDPEPSVSTIPPLRHD